MNPKIEGSYASSWRVSEAGLAAFGLHCRAIAWLGANESATEGVIPTSEGVRLGSQDEIDALLRVGLWDPIAVGEVRIVAIRSGGSDRRPVTVVAVADGWFIPDYLKLNETREEREEFIAEQRRKGKLGGGVRSSRKRQPAVKNTSRAVKERGPEEEGTGRDEKEEDEKGLEKKGDPPAEPTASPADGPSVRTRLERDDSPHGSDVEADA